MAQLEDIFDRICNSDVDGDELFGRNVMGSCLDFQAGRPALLVEKRLTDRQSFSLGEQEVGIVEVGVFSRPAARELHGIDGKRNKIQVECGRCGTAGALVAVKDDLSKKPQILSCAHILKICNKKMATDVTDCDGKKVGSNPVSTKLRSGCSLSSFQKFDAGYADYYGGLVLASYSVADPVSVKRGDAVGLVMPAPESKFRSGVVYCNQAIVRVVNGGEFFLFAEQIIVVSDGSGAFAKPGDSGSLVVSGDKNAPVGLVHAVSSEEVSLPDGRKSLLTAIAPLAPILDDLKLDLLPHDTVP